MSTWKKYLTTGGASLGTNILNATLSGLEVILGTVGEDKFIGSSLGETLKGFNFSDLLSGRGGADTLEGGRGKDTLVGGEGTDTFVFQSIKDTSEGRSKADMIMDFNSNAVDHSDLTGLGPLNFIGKNGFSGTGQVRYEIVNGITYVEVNYTVFGIGSDMCIALVGAMTLDKADFILV